MNGLYKLWLSLTCTCTCKKYNKLNGCELGPSLEAFVANIIEHYFIFWESRYKCCCCCCCCYFSQRLVKLFV